MTISLWTERYRPQKLDDYVWKNNNQRKQVEQWIASGELPHLMFSGPPGVGKAQPLDSKVLTPDGWINMGDILPGQKVLCPNGNIANVLNVFPQGEKEVFVVSFQDGRRVECCAEHLWEVSHSDWSGDKIRVLPTDALMNKLEHLKTCKSNHRIKVRLIGDVEYGNSDLPIPPYALGCLLGDGCLSKNNSIMFSTSDSEMIDYLEESLGPNFGVTHSQKYDYRIIVKNGMLTQTNQKGFYLNPLKASLEKLNLLGVKSQYKFIPEQYKHTSLENRLELLRGLLDTDGSVSQPQVPGQGGTVLFYSSSQQLALDVQWLVWSIGGTAHVKPKQTKFTYNNLEQDGLPSFVVTIRYRDPKKLFKLSRKLNRCSDNYQYRHSLSNVIDSISASGILKPMQCIMIDDPEHLYITDNFIPTHNTTLAKLLLRELKIPETDIMEINASRERKVDEVQSRFQNFVNTWAMGDSGIKYIIYDEADALNPLSQRGLRGDLETYADVCRVIFTCNYPTKIIPALHDRCQKLEFAQIDREEFLARMLEILDRENVFLDEDTVERVNIYIDRAYPSLRKCINLMQENTLNGVLQPPKVADENGKDYLIDMVVHFRRGEYSEGRKLLLAQARPEEYPEIFKFFYQNLDLFGTTITQQEDALLVIRDAVVRHNTVIDPEINVCAMLIELQRIAKPNF